MLGHEVDLVEPAREFVFGNFAGEMGDWSCEDPDTEVGARAMMRYEGG